MPKLMVVEARPNYHLWLRYENGAEGTISLADLVGQGVFAAWCDPTRFANVRIGPFGEVTWGDELELCSDALYLRLTGKTAEEVFGGQPLVHA